jgi:radical SAM superfamily enzyme YgiQ (UPF0313 family)
MKVELVITPTNEPRVFSNVSRILTSNLLANDKLDVIFNSSTIKSFFEVDKKSVRLENELSYNYRKYKLIKKGWMSHFYTAESSRIFKKKYMDSFKYNTILYSAGSNGLFDTDIIATLLKNGFRVVVGGQYVHLFKINTLMYYLRDIFSVPKKYLKNIIFVRGFLDKTTDLYKIVKDWKNIEIENFDIKSIWECEDDYIPDVLKQMGKMDFVKIKDPNLWQYYGAMSVLFRSGCFWKKCAFCTYSRIRKSNLIKNINPEYIAECIVNTAKKYNTNSLYVGDDYFTFNKNIIRILEILKENNILVSVFSGIRLLVNEKYASNIGKYCKNVRLGIENVNDFTLKRINKGYTYKDVLKAFENMKKYFPKELYIRPNFIMDLPFKNKEQIIRNYKRLKDIKIDMANNGFLNFSYKSNFLTIPKSNRDKLVDGKYIVESDKSKYKNGNYLIKRILKESGFDYSDLLWGSYKINYKRFDENGKELDSDINFLSLSDINFLLNN